VDQDTQQLDDNNPKSEATPEVSPDVVSDTGQGQETPPEAVAQGKAEREPVSSMSADERKAALEAIIYAADEPATIEQLAKALGEPKAEVQAALDELVASYASDTRGIEIRGVAGGYKMYTKPQHHDLVRRFIKSLRPPLRLTMPALETLAVISYKQPVTAPEIQEIRGVNTSGVIKTLLDKKLITTAGRKEVIGRPILYRTSKEFLMRFGLSDLGELPSLKEFEALAREALGSDEGVAESDAGDESVLNSMEPTEAEAAAELEAEAAADSNDTPSDEAKPMVEAAAAGADDASAPKQYEQSISPDVAEAIASHPVEAEAKPKPESGSVDAVAASQHTAEAVSGSEVAEVSSEAHATTESKEPTEAVAHQSETVAEASNATEAVEQSEPELTHAVASTEQTPEAGDSTEAISRPIVDAVAETHDGLESQELGAAAPQAPEPESIDARSESVEPLFAEHAPAEATGINMETPEIPESSTEQDGYETEHEISDEILAQLTQGIEIEVSADSLAGLSSNNVPAEEAPTQFYSSHAEPEHQPSPASETTTDHSQPESETTTEPEKSRKAAAGE
jgi:segregation and condensation protein B